MNFPLIFKLISYVLRIEAIFIAISACVSMIYKEFNRSLHSFVLTIVLLLITSFIFSRLKPKDKNFRVKEGFAAVSLAWVFLSFFGALPYFFSGLLGSFENCLFESVSGFTTTGASIIADVESLPRGILFWRSFTHWIGGMGVLMFALALIPSLGASSLNIMKAESPGPTPGKVVPKMKQTASLMYQIYIVLSVVQVILLKLAGLPLFDSIIHMFGSAGTGGFSCMNASVGAYNNPAAEYIITIFVLLFGTNFAIYFYLLKKNFSSVFKDEELRAYLAIVIVATAIITINTLGFFRNNLSEAFRAAFFQVGTIITTTGYATADFNLWPTLSKGILVLLMLTGCCAGSTGGGLKISRIVIMMKAIKSDISKILHPRAVNPVKYNGKIVTSEVLEKIMLFFYIYVVIIVVSTLLVSIENKDLITSVTSVVATISNIGPGLEVVGPTGNYSSFNPFSKIVLIFCMLAGRLEIFPTLVLFLPGLWRKGGTIS